MQNIAYIGSTALTCYLNTLLTKQITDYNNYKTSIVIYVIS